LFVYDFLSIKLQTIEQVIPFLQVRINIKSYVLQYPIMPMNDNLMKKMLMTLSVQPFNTNFYMVPPFGGFFFGNVVFFVIVTMSYATLNVNFFFPHASSP
jgi:hypothetical protein